MIRDGEHQEYTVPGDTRRFTETEIKGYRAAFSAIAADLESVAGFKKQLANAATPAPEKEIGLAHGRCVPRC